MDSFTVKDWIDLTGSLAQIILALAAIVLAWFVYKLTHKIESANLINSAINSVNLVNQMALSSDENLKAIDDLYNDGRDTSIDARRKRWAAFLALQSHQQLYLSRKTGILKSDLSEKHDHQVLEILLRDKEVMSLLAHRGFDTKFVLHCRNIAGD